MKICSYCESMNDDSAKMCTACGASAFKYKCNNCGAIFESAFCPTCGTKAGTQAKVCPQCGERYFSPACPRCGHNTVVNRAQHKTVEEPKRIIIEHVTRTEGKPKKMGVLGKVLLWIFFLPIMALIAVWKSKQLSIKWKLLITIVIPLLGILCFPVNECRESLENGFQSIVSQYTDKTAETVAPSTASSAIVKGTAITVEKTPAPGKETASPTEEAANPVKETTASIKQMRNGYVEGAADHTISVYTVSVPKCFGKPKQSATKDFLEFVNTDEDVILIVSFSKNDVSKQDFVERIERGILNLFQNGELTSSEEIKISGLLGRMLKATGNYSNQHVNATAAVALDENQQGTLSIILMQGENVRYDYYADFDFIVKSVSVTQRSATKQSTASGSQDSDTVSESVKGIMDGYEAFIDSYCEFMKKYSDSDDVAGLALEYIALLMNLSDWENKIDQIDEDSLSEADLMYYDKVMLRCATKLLQAAGD